MSRKLLIILKKEFRETVKTKAFIISTVLMPVFLAVIFGMPAYLLKMNAEKVKNIYIKDDSGLVAPVLQNEVPKTFILKEWTKSKEAAREALKKKEIETFIFIPGDVATSYSFNYEGQTVSDQQTIAVFQNAISSIIRSKKLVERGLKEEDVAIILQRVTAQTYAVSQDGAKKKDVEISFIIAYALVVLMYISVLSYAPRMVQSTIEDKNNRVVEVVLSYVKPFDIMTGKILGNAGVGLFQYLIWGLMGFGVIEAIGVNSVTGMFSQVNPIIFFYFVLFFLLGYFIYSIAFAAIGAMFSDMREANNMMTPFVMLTVIPFLLFAPISQSPNTQLAFWTSEFPYFSSLMLMRIGISEVPAWQIILSVILQIITIIVELWIISKIYRIGILSYGKKPTIKELISWVKAK